MRIIYFSYWGTYAAYTMAAIHAGIYKPDSLPTDECIASQYKLCRRFGSKYGNLIYVGLDNQLREVYSIGCRRHSGMVVRALKHISRIFNIEEPSYFIDAGRLEGILPLLLQIPCFKGNRYAQRLFKVWFHKRYWICTKEVQRVIQELEDGIFV